LSSTGYNNSTTRNCFRLKVKDRNLKKWKEEKHISGLLVITTNGSCFENGKQRLISVLNQCTVSSEILFYLCKVLTNGKWKKVPSAGRIYSAIFLLTRMHEYVFNKSHVNPYWLKRPDKNLLQQIEVNWITFILCFELWIL
jgi:hypothetical protein